MKILLILLIKKIVNWFWRKPDMFIGGEENPYMCRWYIIPRNRWFNIYLHKIVRDDDDRALHDHPWVSVSFILDGSYREITPHGRRVIGAGQVKLRSATYAHRLELLGGPAWTLFVTGPRVRTWGFWCPKRWVPWQEFCHPSDSAKVGKGCGEAE